VEVTGRAAAVAACAIGLAQAAAAGEPGPALVKAFRATCAAKYSDANAADTITVVGRDGWLFFSNELRHVGVGRFWGEAAAKVSRARAEYADPLPAILDYHAQLRKLGIELILLPVPPKAVVYPDKLCPAVRPGADGVPPRLDTAHQAFYKLLGAKGVEVLDLTGAFLAARAKPGSAMYCKHDTHWSGAACVLAARRIAALVKGRPWAAKIARKAFDTETVTVEISGDLWRDLKGAKPPREKLPLRFVGTKDATGLTPVEPDPASPVILLGDSHGLVFHLGGTMHAKGAGLVDQLAAELGTPIERVAVRGSGATPARISLYRKQRRIQGYLANKKLLVWCFSAREFTESGGWRKVPVTRSLPK
jgi:hypothetical protein